MENEKVENSVKRGKIEIAKIYKLEENEGGSFVVAWVKTKSPLVEKTEYDKKKYKTRYFYIQAYEEGGIEHDLTKEFWEKVLYQLHFGGNQLFSKPYQIEYDAPMTKKELMEE